MADIDIDDLIRQFGNNYPKWVNDAIGSRLETTNKLLKELQKQKTASNPEFKKEVDNRKQINKELVAEKKLVEAQNKSLKETNDLYKNLKQNLGGLVKNIDKFKKDLDTMSAQSNSKELVKQSKEIVKETSARKDSTQNIKKQNTQQVKQLTIQSDLTKSTKMLDKNFGGLSKTIDVLVKKINNSNIGNSKPVDVDFTAFNKSMLSFSTQMDGVIKKQDDFAKKIQKITSSINEPVNPNNTSGNNDAERGYRNHLDKTNKSLKNFNENINQSAKSLGDSIQSMNNLSGVSSVTAGAIGGIASKIPLLGVFTLALGAGVGHVIDEMLIARTAFSQLSTNGFGLGTDLIGLSRIARDGKMSIEDFQTAIAQNKAAFMALGPDAASIFSKLQADAKETGSLFKKFGMSLDETTEFLSDNLEFQRSTGRLRDMSDKQRSILAEQELMRLAKLSGVFGKSITEITKTTSDYMQRSSTVANIIQMTQGMSREDRSRIMTTVGDYRTNLSASGATVEMQEILMKAVEVQIANQEGRQILNADTQAMTQLMKLMPELNEYVKQSVQSGAAPEDFADNVTSIMQESFLRGDDVMTQISLYTNSSDARVKALADSILSSVGNSYGFDKEDAAARRENTEALKYQVDPALDAINSAEIAINEVQNTYKQVLMEMFGSDMGTKITEAITSKITGATENLDGFVDNIIDPNYAGQMLDNITEMLTDKESFGDLSASDINTDKLAMIAAGFRLGGPIGAIAALFLNDDAVNNVVKNAITQVTGASEETAAKISPYMEKMILYGIIGSRFGGLKGVAIGAALGISTQAIIDMSKSMGLDVQEEAVVGITGAAAVGGLAAAKAASALKPATPATTTPATRPTGATVGRDPKTGRFTRLNSPNPPKLSYMDRLRNAAKVTGKTGRAALSTTFKRLIPLAAFVSPDEMGDGTVSGSIENEMKDQGMTPESMGEMQYLEELERRFQEQQDELFSKINSGEITDSSVDSLEGGDSSDTLPTTVDDDYEGGLKLTPSGNPDLLLGTDVKDTYELFAQAHHDIMAPVLRELHADTMKNLFIKNTDVIDNIFTKSLDKFLYTKSSIEGIITTSSSEQGLSPAQIKQLEVMGMGSMNSGGLIPMETRIGGTSGGSSGSSSGGYGSKTSGYVGGDMSREQTAKMVYDQFINAGFSENQAEILTAEVNRENVFNEKELYGTHIDPKNKALNRGMFSWQGDRATALMDFLKNEGVLDAQGNMIPGQETLNAQAKFAKLEMQQNLHSGSSQQNDRIQGFLQNPNIDQESGHRIMGKDFIRWAYGESGIHANSMDRITEGHLILQRALQNTTTQTVPNNNNMVEYNMGPNRPFKPDDDLINSVQSSVEKIFGIGSKINVISGQEGDLPQYGQARHKTGLAADFDIYDSEGNIVTFGDPRLKEFMIDAAQNQGIKGIGLGPEYMKGPDNAARFHMDKLAHSLYSGNMDETWGSLANKYEAEIEEAMAFFDKNVNIVQQSMTSKIDDISTESSMSEVEKLRKKLDSETITRKSKLQAATMAPDRNESIQMKYTTSEEEAKEKDRLNAMGASNKEIYDDHILRELRQLNNTAKRQVRATEKNGSGLAPGSPSC